MIQEPEFTLRVIEQMVGSGITRHPTDNRKAVLLIRAGEAVGLREETKAIVKAARRSWLGYLTITQRRWQRHDRRVHEDRNLRARTARQNFGVYAERGTAREVARRCLVEGIDTREKYVRCTG